MPNSKKEILLIECISSGYMYLPEIIERGYKILLVQPKCDDKHLEYLKIELAKNYAKNHGVEDFEWMLCEFDSDEIINAIKDHIPNIVCSVAGSEMGVRLNDEVCTKLGLPGNDSSTSYKRCTKAGMISALEQAGIRAIKSQKVVTESDIRIFMNKYGLNKCFMKFSESAASFESRVCNSVEDAIQHYRKISNMPNYFGNEEDDILVQEYIEGDEYVVNTISCQGKHVVTDIWKYDRIVCEDGSVVYNSVNFVRDVNNEQMQCLIDYSYKVLDAVDMKFGPCHGEFKIDANGPVLIETNCRPMGFSTTRGFQWAVARNYIVDWSLNSYIDQENFLKKIERHDPYQAPKSGRMKMIILPYDCEGDIAPLLTIGEHLKTFHNHNGYDSCGIQKYNKTEDLGNTPLIIKLVGDTEEDVDYDCNFLRKLETKYLDLVICPKPELSAGNQRDIDTLVKSLSIHKSFTGKIDKTRTLVITDNDCYEVCEGKYEPVHNQTDPLFDQILYANAKAQSLVDKINEIFASFKYLKPGGKLICDESVADILPYGIDCFNLLKEAARL